MDKQQLQQQIAQLQQENQMLRTQLESSQSADHRGFFALYQTNDFEPIHKLLENLPYFVCILNSDLRLVYINRTLEGLNLEELRNQTVYDTVPASAHQHIKDNFEKAAASKKAVKYVVEQPTPLGIHKILTTLQPLVDEKGEIVRWVTIAHDISEELSYKNNLAKAQQRYIALNDNLPIAIIECDLEGKIFEWNLGAEEMLGFSKEEMLHRSIVDIRQIRYLRDKIADAYKKAEAGEQNIQLESKLLRKDGKTVFFKWYLTAIKNSNGEIESFVNVGYDQTDIQLARQRAENLAEAKSRFIATVSHELRTPMHGILNAADLLRETCNNDAQLKWVQLIHESSDSLLHVIDSVLDFSRIEADKLSLHYQWFNLQPLVEAVCQLLQTAAKQKNNTIELDYQGNDIAIYSDAGRLRQILYNLVGNAVKFTRSGKITVVVSHVNITNQEKVSIAVHDQGIGIAEDALPYIFDSFTQANNSISHEFGGSGLGLAISKHLAALLDGDIHVTSQQGVGSCFKLEFLSNIQQALDNQKPVHINQQYQGHVLVVDDNPVNVSICVAMLKKLGLNVSSAADGKEAVERAQEQAFDIILMDIQMPVMDGYQATKLLRQASWNEFIVGVSANAIDPDGQHLFDKCMTKPFNQKALIKMLEQSPVTKSK